MLQALHKIRWFFSNCAVEWMEKERGFERAIEDLYMERKDGNIVVSILTVFIRRWYGVYVYLIWDTTTKSNLMIAAWTVVW